MIVPPRAPRQMHEILAAAAPTAAKQGWFEPRSLFRRRVGRMIVFPLGLGSALDKAVREGHLVILGKERGRRRRYAFTPAGRDYLRHNREA